MGLLAPIAGTPYIGGSPPGAVFVESTGLQSLKKANLSGTTAPTVNEDSGDGYAVNSVWLDTTNGVAYTCLNASVGAAVWRLSALPAGSTYSGGVLTLTSTVLAGGVVINEAGGDFDFRLEGDTDVNLIYADAGLDKVGIGKAPNAWAGKLVVQATDANKPVLSLQGASAQASMYLDVSNSSETSLFSIDSVGSPVLGNGIGIKFKNDVGTIAVGIQVDGVNTWIATNPFNGNSVFGTGVAGTGHCYLQTQGMNRVDIDSAGNVILTKGTTAAELRLQEPSGSGVHYVAFISAARNENLKLTLPITLPTINQVLTASTVSGEDIALGWSTVSGGGGGDAFTTNPLSQFAATTSAQLAGVISDETGSGALVFATTPTLVTPVLGAATATSINKVILTAVATGSTFTLADGKTFTVSNTLTLTSSESATLAIGGGGTLGSAAYTSSGAYATAGHNHDLTYSQLGHTHAGVYAPVSHAHTGEDITSGTVAAARLGTGSGGSTKFLREDSTWQTISGGGDALTSASLDQFADVTQTATKTLAITESTTLAGGSHSGTNTGDNAVNSLYSGLVSNATHTGDATGATALTVVGINGTLLSSLATGILKNTTTTGVPSIAVAGDFPTLNQNTTGSSASCTGNAATVTTNANLTGPITSIGNATSIASQTGTGTKFVMDTSPTLVTPILGIATATSINKVTITEPAASATLTIANGKTLTVNNILTLTATDNATLAIGAGGTLGSAAYTASGDYATAGHNHTGVYAPLSHAHSGADITSGVVVSARIDAALANTAEIANTPAGSGWTEDIDWGAGRSQTLNVSSTTGNGTVTFSNPPPTFHGIIKLVQGATPRTITWPAAKKWDDTDGEPTYSANKTYLIGVYYDGTTYFLGSSHPFT